MTSLVRKRLAKKWIEISGKELYAIVSLLVGLIYVLRQTNFWQSLEIAIALSASASVAAISLYDAFLKSVTIEETKTKD